ncbi:MAG: small basic family protein, partial [Phascolarctobacterium sp.]|nr:small basic family protein [Phascolarctobacterium sp.]
MLYWALGGLLLGIFLGVYSPIALPPQYAKLLSVAVMAGLDTVLGGIYAAMCGKYDTEVFVSGFFINGILAVILCYAGIMLGIDVYMVG